MMNAHHELLGIKLKIKEIRDMIMGWPLMTNCLAEYNKT